MIFPQKANTVSGAMVSAAGIRSEIAIDCQGKPNEYCKKSKLLFAAAGAAIAAFVLCVIFMKSDTVIWRAFSVCMPATGICLSGGTVLFVIDFIRKRL